jgi:hypothetical protein
MKDFEADDPMELVGVELPGSPETMRDMAYAFAEEFARMGYRGSQIETLFKTPFYAGAYRAYLALGEAEIQAIIGECVAAWGGLRFSILDFGFSIEEGKNQGFSILDFGFSVDGGGDKSKIENPKSKMGKGGVEHG